VLRGAEKQTLWQSLLDDLEYLPVGSQLFLVVRFQKQSDVQYMFIPSEYTECSDYVILNIGKVRSGQGFLI
jgi:hypothetical protein